MYENRHGRFTAVDPLLASGKSANPQTFNRFVYTSNNPVCRIDVDGRDWIEVVVDGYRVPRWKDGPVAVGEKAWSGGPVYWAKDVLKWVALPPNGGTTRIALFGREEEARWQYFKWTNFDGWGSVPVIGTFLNGLAGMKTGDVDEALSGFALSSVHIATIPRTVGGWLIEASFSVADYEASQREIEGSDNSIVSMASFTGVIRVGKVPNTDSELVSKGVHLHTYVGRNRKQVEVAIELGPNGELVYRAIGKNARDPDLAKSAVEIAKEQIEQNAAFRNRVIKTADAFASNTTSHPNSARRVLAAGFQELADFLRRLK